MKPRLILCATLLSCCLPPAQAEPEQAGSQIAKGVVFHDRNDNRRRDPGEPGLGGVRVSNGKAVVQTDADGRYQLPIEGDAILFVCKPRGWIYPVDQHQLPQFYYIHKPNGSPDEGFRYKGSEPTGPLPASVDFPLRPYEVPGQLKAVLLGDPQPTSLEDVRYFGRDIMSELVGVDAEFGVTLGDIVGNQLDLFQPMNEMQALAGIPWHNVIGNHDLNFQAADDRHANETFHHVYGPSDYAFQYGNVHFLAMDNVVYHGREERGYHGGLSPRQLAFIENYLATVPRDHRILIGTHIPLTNGNPDEEQPTQGLRRVLELLSEFPHTASFSAHTHMNAIYHLGPEYGYRYRGPNAAAPERQTAEGQAKAGGHKHVADADDGQDGHEHAHGHGREHEHGQGHGQGREYEREQEQGHEREQGHQHGVHVHHNVGTSSGTWWKGPLDSRGIPMTTMRDGTPNGYAIATFDGPRMTVRWKAAHHEEDYQMNIFVADSVAADDLANERGTVMVNVFNGQPGSAVEMRVRGHSEWTSLDHQLRFDPHYVRQQQIDQATPMQGTKRLNEPRKSTHIWVGKLPPSLPAGTHLVEVRAEDAYGQVFVDRRPFRVR